MDTWATSKKGKKTVLQKSTPSAVLQAEPAPKAGPACTAVFVVDKNDRPIMPCSPRKARLLLNAKRADVFCQSPFTIRLLDREEGAVQEMELKFDPGSKTTGIVLVVRGAVRGWFCVAAWELTHRGQQIVDALIARSALRQGRRSRNTRYRPARFSNRTKPENWLPPSLLSRLGNIDSFTHRLLKVVPLSGLACENVKFDMQLIQNPNISGVQYQQGTLAGYEVREYLLIKWKHQCAYCKAKDCPLQIEHIVPKSRGGTNRIDNLCMACERCNQKKGNRPVEEFLKNNPGLLKLILAQAKSQPSLKDAAAVNTLRLALMARLQAFDLPVSTGTGGQTKFNRTQQGYAKSHWADAACVGSAGAHVDVSGIQQVTLIQAKGRGDRQMCKPDKFGFPRTAPKSVKRLHGFQTGDRVRLSQPSGKYKGVHEGIVSIRATGQFDIKCGKTKITAPHTRFTRLARFDGYTYTHKRAG